MLRIFSSFAADDRAAYLEVEFRSSTKSAAIDALLLLLHFWCSNDAAHHALHHMR
jgi:hypothetical protein